MLCNVFVVPHSLKQAVERGRTPQKEDNSSFAEL